MGQFEKGLAALAEAFAVAENGECIWEAEVCRLKGELPLAQEGKSQKSKFSGSKPPVLSTQVAAEAEACFLKAIDIARCQSAKSWELRATVSVARLWQQ